MTKHPLWTCRQSIKFDEIEIPLNLPPDGSYIRVNSPLRKILYRILIKPFRLRNSLLVDGYITGNIGKWIRRYSKEGDIILDIGCGDIRLYRYVPQNRFYYAFDISINELFLQEKLREKNRNLYFAFASATDIPLESNTIDIAVCTEVFDHIPQYQDAIREILRVIKPNGLLLVSVSNNSCYKYKVKGKHAAHHYFWSYEEFLNIMKNGSFFIEGCMMGRWVRLPLWLTKTSYTLPTSPEKEFFKIPYLNPRP
jgi:SAM-dependent methyltransferase